MPEITTFFRHCPSCGRRFEIRLVGKKLVDEKQVRQTQFYHSNVPYYNELTETMPLTIDIKEFQYAYKCRHCGHQWVEIR